MKVRNCPHCGAPRDERHRFAIDYEAAAEAMWNESAFSKNQTWTDAPLEYRSKYRGLAAICVDAAVGEETP